MLTFLYRNVRNFYIYVRFTGGISDTLALRFLLRSVMRYRRFCADLESTDDVSIRLNKRVQSRRTRQAVRRDSRRPRSANDDHGASMTTYPQQLSSVILI